MKVAALIFLAMLTFSLPLQAGESVLLDERYTAWLDGLDALLKDRVSESARDGIRTAFLDYEAIAGDPRFAQLRADLRALPPLDGHSPQFAIALWINIYNFIIIEKVVDNPGIKSVRDLSTLFNSVWDQPSGTILGEQVSPGYVEHKILRARFSEPRIHFAIVCASLSCPDLPGEVFREATLESQLERQTALFLANESKGMRVDRERKVLYISKIFSWFKGDFGGDVKLWLYRQGVIDENIYREYRIKYMDYNWTLNKRL